MAAEINRETVPVLGKPGTEFILLDLTDVSCCVGTPVILPVNPLYLSSEIPKSSLSSIVEQLCL